MKKRTIRQPQLSYNQEWDRWVLSLPAVNGAIDVLSYQLVVRCSWQGEEDGWFSYRYICWDAGEWTECVTHAEYEGTRNDVCEHEGPEIAEVWHRHQTNLTVIHDDHPVFALRKYWEAMMELQLFMPSVNLREWKGHPLSDYAQELMRAIRDQQMEDIANEMRAMQDEPDEDRLGFGLDREPEHGTP